MSWILRVAIVVALLILLLAGGAFLLPTHYRVERGTVIHSDSRQVYAKLADLRAWKSWAVWYERDPAMEITYSNNPDQVGGWVAWKSKSQGDGRMVLTTLTPFHEVRYCLEMADMGMASEGSVELTETDGQVTVRWADQGDLGSNPINRWFGLFFDRMIGPDFQSGLAKLKNQSEQTRS